MENHNLNGTTYTFVRDALQNPHTRQPYFDLVKKIYRLDFSTWHQPQYWDNRFIPYVLMEGELAISSVAVCVNDVYVRGQKKIYVQLSTVMTLPEYRNKGLNRLLMEAVLGEWKTKCDAIYLYANDKVVDFYPKFGFQTSKEYTFSQPLQYTQGICRKLDIDNPEDWRLILQKYALGNPFAAITVENQSQFIYHCLHSFKNNMFYVEKYDALVIAQNEGKALTCYDIFTASIADLKEIVSIVANEKTTTLKVGFTPQIPSQYSIEVLQEEDTHLFVLSEKDNIFEKEYVYLTQLSRA